LIRKRRKQQTSHSAAAVQRDRASPQAYDLKAFNTMNPSTGGEQTTVVAVRPVLSANAESRDTNVYEINPLHDSRWETFVKSHSRASVFHSTKWLRALQAAYGYEPLVVTTCSPDSGLTNGLVFCQVNSWLTGRRFVSLPFSDHCEPLVNNSDELDCLLRHMKRYVGDRACRYIEIRPLSCQPGSQTGLAKSAVYSLHRLDLSTSMQELFRQFHKDCVQRKIRRAEKENLQYEEGTSDDVLQKFYRLVVMTRRRQNLPPQPLAWFRSLIGAFGKDLKIRVASKDGVAVASILTLSHQKSMVYKYGCSDAAFNNLGGTPLLFWKTIQESKEGGFVELDMGRSSIDNLGLIAFKEHWGAVRTAITYWTYPHRQAESPTGWKTSVARKVVSVAPDAALEAVGKLLYRHIG
jgi:lipid II:glycine glycyltransferase (peptidoglycan interpeptide bridge formation enzyme)